ncbi:YnfA family protein [Tundrisphaera sp. TA3]|uniref:YnfA family protein n=1 Tax=Tundrisphaera sp. TA3 TaxID=3435775 RepID=UPI003EBDEBA8
MPDHRPALLAILLFLAAGLCEIGGGYLVWACLRDRRSPWFGVVGVALLILYGVIPTLQPASFGRTYAAYGGVFVALSIAWGWAIDGAKPDRYDLIGGAICLVGVVVIFHARRG